MYCLCVNVYYCHRVSTQLQLNIPYHGVVGIATRYGLDYLGIESWCGAKFSSTFHTGLGTQPTSNKIGYRIIPGGIAADVWS
jgi:hypothetical protein